jgi:ElaB/YqjD/DUF883 family membrane-anchored ribosome-binding protein
MHMKTRSRSGRSNGKKLRRQAAQVGDHLQEMGTIARHAAQDRVDGLRDAAAEYYERGLDKMQEMEHSVEGYICNQPVKSVLIAAGLGLFVGRFLMRR